MKKYLIVLICSFFVHSITNAQSVDQLRNNYTGNTTWNATTGVLKFSSNGTINFTQNGWKIPDNVKKVIIGANVRLVGRFDWDNAGAITIEGEDRKTSVVFGTNQKEYAKANGGGDKLSGVRATDGDVTLKNFTLLDSKGFGFTHRGGGFLSVIDCDLIDERGGNQNNSDGIVCWGGGLIRGCYIETGDDNIKVYGDMTVENTHCHMVDNAVPVQLGWGNYGSGAKGTFKNFLVTGNSGRFASGKGVINARSGNYNKTLIFEGLTIDNPEASLFGFRDGTGRFDITMTDVDIKVKKFAEYFNNGVTGTISICGTTYTKSSTQKTFKCGDGANLDDQTGGEIAVSDIDNLSASSPSCTSVVLNWADVEGEEQYRIRRKITGTNAYEILADVSAETTSYTDNTVAESTSYDYMVRPMQAGVAVALSNVPTIQTPVCAVELIEPVNSWVNVAQNDVLSGIVEIQTLTYDGSYGENHGDGIQQVNYQIFDANDLTEQLDYFSLTTSPFYWNLNTLNYPNGEYQIRSGAISSDANELKWVVLNISINNAVTDVENERYNKVQLFPNPVNDVLKIKGEFAEWKLLDTTGRVLQNGTSTEVDLSHIKSGLLFLHVDGVNHQIVKQ